MTDRIDDKSRAAGSRSTRPMQLAVFRSPDLIRNLTDPTVQDIIEGSLPEYLTKQRWFSSKDQRILRSGLRNVAFKHHRPPDSDR